MGNGAGVTKNAVSVGTDEAVGSGLGGSMVGEDSTSILATDSASESGLSVI